MADAILYSYLDQGAPDLQLGGNISSVGGVQCLYNLLVPVLVTGYGAGATAKPGQGWTLVHADLPLGFKLQAPDGVYYIFCRGPSQTHAFAPSFQMWMAESLTDLAAYPPTGANVRSGNHSSYSSAPHRHWGSVRPYFGNPVYGWYVVARGSQVFINIHMNVPHNSSSSDNPNITTGSSMAAMMFLGNPVLKDPTIPKNGPQASLILGGANNTAYLNTWNPTSEQSGTYLYGGCTRLRNFITGAVEVGAINTVLAGIDTGYIAQTGGGRYGISTYPPDLTLERHPIWEDGHIGYVPGLFRNWYYSFRRPDLVLTALGRANSVSEFVIPFDIDGEPFYLLPTGIGCAFVSLLEKYWN